MNLSEMNVFKFPNPQHLYCTVWMYRVHHPTLAIRVHHAKVENFVWLFFTGVSYFEGPLNWKGAEFNIASRDEQLKLHQRLGHNKGDQIESVLANQKLYVVDPTMDWLDDDSDLQIKILAYDCTISTKRYTIGDFFA
jgi:hypothetical protein